MSKTTSATVARRAHLVDVLEAHARETPDTIAFAWRSDDLLHEDKLCYRELLTQAKRIAAELQSRFRPGDRALLLFPQGLEFIASFFGCLYAGVVAIPICPPRRSRHSAGIERIIENADPRIVLSTADFVANRQDWYGEIPSLLRTTWLDLTCLRDGEASWVKPVIESETLAFLQYTSGTTGMPKGVMVTHDNLVHNAEALRGAYPPGHSQRAFWLPMYHDMGLIGAMLQTVFDGATSSWISPSAFLRRPLAWLELISQTGAAASGAPDFAYALCVDRSTPESREGLDLSRWTVAGSGAELVRPSTIERFSHAFAPCGFRRTAFQPGYGLAEATLVVSYVRPGSSTKILAVEGSAIARNTLKPCSEAARDVRQLASNGHIGGSQHVAIVDPDSGRPCAAGTIGEIWVSGPNVARGYYNNEAATRETFQARLPGDDRHYLRTGDLGCLLDGHLYVTGRLKELIVVRGRNVYPQDVERVIRECDARLQGAVTAVFSVELLGSERLVVIQEFGRAHRHADFDQLGQEIRLAIGRECGIEVFDLLFVREGTILRTTSGKVRRLQCREDYLAERIEPTARWTDRRHEQSVVLGHDTTKGETTVQARSVDEIRQWLLQRIGMQLDVPPQRLSEAQAFSEMGLGSLDMVLICDEFERWLGGQLPPTTIFNYPTIAALAEHLGRASELRVVTFRADAEEDPLRKEIEQLSNRELEEFVAREMAKLTGPPNQRAA